MSEVMLQQTQVSRVREIFPKFLERFPTLSDLARAHEDDVLSAWTGLGYYRRARLLHASAKSLDAHLRAERPLAQRELEKMPGLGAYTSRAVASLCAQEACAVVDTNVARVLLRVEGKRLDPAQPATRKWLAARAQAVGEAGVRAGARNVGHWNEAIMELGALLCKSASPACGQCPLQGQCVAHRQGTTASIPVRTAQPTRTHLTFACVVVTRSDGALLMEQRGGATGSGLWSGLWQPPTLERAGKVAVKPGEVVRQLGLRLRASQLREREQFTFLTTHRAVQFVVFACNAAPAKGARRWVNQADLSTLAMSSPVRRVLGID